MVNGFVLSRLPSRLSMAFNASGDKVKGSRTFSKSVLIFPSTVSPVKIRTEIDIMIIIILVIVMIVIKLLYSVYLRAKSASE